MANQEEQKSDGHAGANLRPCWTQSFCQSPHQQDCAGGQVTNSRGIQRRNRGYRVANRQVRPAPDDVNRKERSENCQTITRGCTKRQRRCFGSKSGAFRFCTHLYFLSLNARTFSQFFYFESSFGSGSKTNEIAATPRAPKWVAD